MTNNNQVFIWAFAENIITLICTASIVLGLFWFGAGGWSLWGLLLMLNMNNIKLKTCPEKDKST